ncbi:MAG: hypothetical protein AB200_02710 [Parcubacteria bacterium C7867-005]|nr:MAG: hypothetical protein AB200_02710 [Parcubacteria bacterium C7867-005]
MSNSVALVAIDRVAKDVRGEISVSDRLVTRIAAKRNITPGEARERIIASTVRSALKLSNNDEKIATTALVIVHGKSNRLPQCTRLLRKHDASTVSVAYEVKGELAMSNVSLRVLCQFVDFTDRDMEGEVSELRDVLEEIAMKVPSKEYEWSLHHRLREGLERGRPLAAMRDEIMDEIDRRISP